jgi:hypothetical protein
MAAHPVRHIVIVGGGSAGWLTAGILAADHLCGNRSGAGPGAGITITLIESPGVPPIGVGEGTWPSMRDTLRRIGVREADFFRACDASFKQGSRFDRWVDGSDGDTYFHPFVVPQGYDEANLVKHWHEHYRHIPFALVASYQPHLCLQGKAPKQVVTPEFAAVANYGYHLDAGKFGVFLRDHCIAKLSVRHVLDHVTAITSHDNGDIAALETREHGSLHGDLFVDCTGLQSLLLGQHYGVAFRSQKQVLFNDSALAVQLPYPDDNHPIASQTTSTAQNAGWIWDIGLPTRRGVGHVYSSAHTSDQQAADALSAYLRASGEYPVDLPTPRKISFDPGYRTQFWHRNCVAIGLSAGFIEPLEASALALVEMSANMLSDELPAERGEMDIISRRFNEAFTYRWERVIDFLKLHYVLSRRADSDFWRDHRASAGTAERLAELLALWRHRPPMRNDFPRIEEVFPTASYQYVLYGMGFETRFAPRQSDLPQAAEDYFREAGTLASRMLAGLPDNRQLINHIRRHGMHTI